MPSSGRGPEPGFPPVAIVGRGCVLPGAWTPEALRDAVERGADLLTTPTPGAWRVAPERVVFPHADREGPPGRGGYVQGSDEAFDPTGFLLPAERVASLDRSVQWLLHAGRSALHEAGLERGDGSERMGVVAGSLLLPTVGLSRFAESVWFEGPGALAEHVRARLERPDPRDRFMSGLPVRDVARALGMGGRTLALDAACASSLYAIRLACEALHDGEADLMLAGAVNGTDPLFLHAGFQALQALSPTGRSRPFHRDADGLVPAEGAVLLALRRLDDAVAAGDRILGVIRGIGLSNDGGTRGLLVPDPSGQERAMRAAFAESGLRPQDISLMECHATGTPVGDAAELRSVAAVYGGDTPIPIGSLKSNLGHLLTASGAAGLLKVLGAMESGIRPPTLHGDAPLQELAEAPVRVVREAEPWEATGLRRAAVSSFGFGGNNAHLLVEAWEGTGSPVRRGRAGRSGKSPGRSSAEEETLSMAAPGTAAASARAKGELAVVAASVLAADAVGFDAFARAVLEGKPRLRPGPDGTPEGRMDPFEVALPGLRFPPADLAEALPQQTVLLEAARIALDGGPNLPPERTGVFVGMQCDAEVARPMARVRLEAWAPQWANEAGVLLPPGWTSEAADAVAPPLTAPIVLGTLANVVANRVGSQFGFQGPSHVLSDEELSGIRALEVAARALRTGALDAAVVGAVDLSCEPVHRAASRAVLDADFRTPGDAAVVLVLRRREDAERAGDRILALLPDPGVTPAGVAESDGVAELHDLTPIFGHPHAASGLLQVAAGVACCASGALPGPDGATPWTTDGAPRICRIRVGAFEGPDVEVCIQEAPGGPWRGVIGPATPRLALLRASDRAALLRLVEDAVENEAVFAGSPNEVGGASVGSVPTDRTAAGAGGVPTVGEGPVRLVLSADSEAQWKAGLAGALDFLRGEADDLPEGVALRDAPLEGELAFVFTGAGAAHPGMGRELVTALPGCLSEVSRVIARSRTAVGWAWAAGCEEPSALQKLTGASFLSQFHARITLGLLGLRPTAALGLSSGETNAIAALGAWEELDGLLDGLVETGMYDREVGGAFRALERAWGHPASWAAWRVLLPLEAVERAVEAEPLVWVTMRQGIADCVIGGEREACERVVQALGRERAYPLGYDLAVHAPVLDEVADRWRELHHRPTRALPDLRFYSSGSSEPYHATADAVADALTGMARSRVDFPAMVLRAWEDGVRVFVEHGPRDLCARWAREALGDRPHLVVSLDRPGVPAVRHLLALAAELLAAGVPCDPGTFLDTLGAVPAEMEPRARLPFGAHAPLVRLHPLPKARDLAMTPAPALPSALREWDPRWCPETQEYGAAVAGNGARRHPPGGEEATAPPEIGSAAPTGPAAASGRAPVSAADGAPRAGASPNGGSAGAGSGAAPAAVGSRETVGHRAAPGSRAAAAIRDQVTIASQVHRAFVEAQTEAHRTFLRTRGGTEPIATARAGTAPPAAAPSGPVRGPAPLHPRDRASSAPPPEHRPDAEGGSAARSASGSTDESTVPPAPSPTAVPRPALPKAPERAPVPPPARPVFDRADLEHLASGRISERFGPLFEVQDAYPRQVRMPMPPLLLADRVMELEGEPGSMGIGRIVTETDVPSDAWYLHEGRMPAGIQVEAGQADLLLCSWLGADLLNRGERVYRLLGCELTFHGSRPSVGETLRYDIRLERHARTGDVRLFFFGYDCTVDGEPRLSVRGGHAGFFTDAELQSSGGVIWDPADEEPVPPAVAAPTPGFTSRRAFSPDQVRAFAAGRPWETFGEGFEWAAPHVRSPRIQSGEMLLIDEVEAIDPEGGPWGRGYLRARRRIRPDDWFFPGHFKDDPTMPGTLMYEGGLQAMAFYLAAAGLTVHRDGWRFEPVPEVPYAMVCRGQVVPTSREVVYELFVHGIEEGPEPILWADILLTADGLKAFHCRRMGLRLVPDWPLEARPDLRPGADVRPVASVDGFAFGHDSLVQCAWGRPSLAFGPRFARFDSSRTLPRLPGEPYHFMSRVAEVSGPMGEVRAGTSVEVEYDIPPDAWYFASTPGRTMPFCVLLEAALQPCGWLTAYMGIPLALETDLRFRNLNGDGTILGEVHPGDGILTTHVTCTDVSRSGETFIESFEVRCCVGDRPIFELKTAFGHFPAEALAQQVGVPFTEAEREAIEEAPANVDIDLRVPAAREGASDAPASEGGAAEPGGAPGFGPGRGRLAVLDRVTGLWPEGSRAGRARLRAEMLVDPSAWFFTAHFFQDPVQPGSLGIEAMIQLLQFHAMERGLHRGFRAPRFEGLAVGRPVSWRYRGQVTPGSRRVLVEAEVTDEGRDDRGAFVTADCWLWVDGRRIYAAKALSIRVVEGDAPEAGAGPGVGPELHLGLESPGVPVPVPGEETEPVVAEFTLDPAEDAWLLDHRPTFTVPAVPLTFMADWMAAAALGGRDDVAIVQMRDLEVRGWLVCEGPRRMRTEVRQPEGAPEGERHVRLLAWREASVAELSRFEPVAEARFQLAAKAPEPAASLPSPGETEPAPDPYEGGALIHGPAFQILRELHLGRGGASALLDAGGGAAPVGVLHPLLLDGITHAIPNAELHRWSPEIDEGQVAYPVRIPTATFHGPRPPSGPVRCEVRFDGFDGDPRFPRFRVQLDTEQGRWADLLLVAALHPKGPIGRLPGPERRAFLLERRPVPGAGLSRADGDVTRLRRADVQASDWLPGTLARLYRTEARGEERVVRIAVQEHVARKVGLHPGSIEVDASGRIATSRHLPFSAFPVEVSTSEEEIVVRDARPERPDFSEGRRYWQERLGVARWPVEDMYFAMAEKFVRRVVLEDPEGFERIRGRSAVYVGNHQVAVESFLFALLTPALTGVPTVVLAKSEVRTRWLDEFLTLAEAYPKVRLPEFILYLEQKNPIQVLRTFERCREQMTREGLSALVHVEGTRSLACRRPVTVVSSSLIDMAMGADAPIVPVRFLGGLPVDPLESRLHVPLGHGSQDYHFGTPILPEELAALPYADRRARVLAGINALGPGIEHEGPNPPDPAFEASVRAWMEASGADEEYSILFRALERLEDPGPEIAELLAAVPRGSLEVPAGTLGRWTADLARRLFGDRGPKVTRRKRR